MLGNENRWNRMKPRWNRMGKSLANFSGVLSNEIIKSRFIFDRGASYIFAADCSYFHGAWNPPRISLCINSSSSFNINKPIHFNWHFVYNCYFRPSQTQTLCNCTMPSRANKTPKALNYIFPASAKSVSTFWVNKFTLKWKFAVILPVVKLCHHKFRRRRCYHVDRRSKKAVDGTW